MSRSASTFSLNDSAKSTAVVQRSNSLDHPHVRARVPVCIRTPCSPTPCSPTQIPAHGPGPSTALELCQSPCAKYRPSAQELKSILHAPLSTQPAQVFPSLPTSQQSTTSTTSIPATRNSAQLNSKITQPNSSQHVSRHHLGFQLRSLAPQSVNVRGGTLSESRRDPQAPLDPRKAVLTSHRRETLL